MINAVIHFWDLSGERQTVTMGISSKAAWSMGTLYQEFNDKGHRGRIIRFDTFTIQ